MIIPCLITHTMRGLFFNGLELYCFVEHISGMARILANQTFLGEKILDKQKIIHIIVSKLKRSELLLISYCHLPAPPPKKPAHWFCTNLTISPSPNSGGWPPCGYANGTVHSDYADFVNTFDYLVHSAVIYCYCWYRLICL